MDSKGATWFQTEIEQYPKSRDHKNNLLQFLDRVKSLSAKEKNEILPKLDFEPMFSVLIKWNKSEFRRLSVASFLLKSLFFQSCLCRALPGVGKCGL